MAFRETVRGYGWRIWAGWIVAIVVLAVPVGVLLAALAGEGSGSGIIVGIWIVALVTTVIYFEFVNARRRRSAAAQSRDTTATILAGAALAIGITFLLLGGPLALLLAFLAWRRIRTSEPYTAGLASTAVAFFVGTLDTIYLALVLAGYEI